MSDDVIIRPPVKEDASRILELVTELNKHQGDPVDLFTMKNVEQDVLGSDSPIDTLVADASGTLVGYVFYHPSYESGYGERGLFITDIHVTEKARGSGVGRKLIQAVAKEADKKGYTFLWWASKLWNTGAQRFYEEIGAISEPVIAHALIHDNFKKLLND